MIRMAAPSAGVRPRKSSEYVCWHVALSTAAELSAAVSVLAALVAAGSSAANMSARPGATNEGAAEPAVCTWF